MAGRSLAEGAAHAPARARDETARRPPEKRIRELDGLRALAVLMVLVSHALGGQCHCSPTRLPRLAHRRLGADQPSLARRRPVFRALGLFDHRHPTRFARREALLPKLLRAPRAAHPAAARGGAGGHRRGLPRPRRTSRSPCSSARTSPRFCTSTSRSAPVRFGRSASKSNSISFGRRSSGACRRRRCSGWRARSLCWSHFWRADGRSDAGSIVHVDALRRARRRSVRSDMDPLHPADAAPREPGDRGRVRASARSLRDRRTGRLCAPEPRAASDRSGFALRVGHLGSVGSGEVRPQWQFCVLPLRSSSQARATAAYLIHLSVYTLIDRWGWTASPSPLHAGLLRLLIGLPIIFGIAALSKRFLEDPFLSLKGRLAPRERPEAA